MSLRIGIAQIIGGILVTLSVGTRGLAAEEQLEPLLDGVAEYWSSSDVTLSADQSQDFDDFSDTAAVTPAQMLTPQRSLGSSRMAQRPRRSSVARRNPNLASVPFMIGDTTAGTCVTYGGVTDVELGHPTLGCSRLNISEGNTPLPTDRIYFSYRHFHNATLTRVFSNFADYNVDRFTMAGERTFFDGMISAELRLPLENRLTSDVSTNIVQFDPPSIPGFVTGIEPIIGGRRTELANMSMIFKALLLERDDFAVSAGLGVTLPTAKDVNYNATIDTFVVEGALTALNVAQIQTIAANETVYLAPFLSWLCTPSPRFFHQGFLQVEVAANPSRVHTNAAGRFTFDLNGDTIFDPFDPTDGTLAFATPFLPVVGSGSGLATSELHPQTLLRLNLGFGYVLHENRQADWIQKLTGLFEVHYTGTLSDANISRLPLNLFFNGIQVPPDDPIFSDPNFDELNNIFIGNRDNQIHIVNLTAGLSANMGNLVVTHGLSAPVTNRKNRGFDFEYNLQVQRPF
ncbi:MAG: hypothetical protein ACR2NM_09785 [Bythopirellula sp.]